MKTAIERWAYQRTLSVDDFELLQELYDWATDVHDYAAQLEAENEALLAALTLASARADRAENYMAYHTRRFSDD